MQRQQIFRGRHGSLSTSLSKSQRPLQRVPSGALPSKNGAVPHAQKLSRIQTSGARPLPESVQDPDLEFYPDWFGDALDCELFSVGLFVFLSDGNVYPMPILEDKLSLNLHMLENAKSLPWVLKGGIEFNVEMIKMLEIGALTDFVLFCEKHIDLRG